MRRLSAKSTPTKQPPAPSRAAHLHRGLASHASLGAEPFVPKLVQTAEEGRAPRAHRKDAAKKNHGVDAEPPFARPVIARVEVKPDGELVQRERRAHAEADRHEPAEKNRKRRVCSAKIEQPPI